MWPMAVTSFMRARRLPGLWDDTNTARSPPAPDTRHDHDVIVRHPDQGAEREEQPAALIPAARSPGAFPAYGSYHCNDSAEAP
jgi:hypothetical protein